MNDSRLTRWCAHLDDIRTEIVDMQQEGPSFLEHICKARENINFAIRSLQDAQSDCEVCGGVGKVLRAKMTINGFDWLAGDRIPCPSCTK